MCNEEWVAIFPNAVVDFLPEGIFDHTPAIISLIGDVPKGNLHFHYYNWWSQIDGYFDMVEKSWRIPFYGNPMFQLVTNLKLLKKTLRDFSKNNHGNLAGEERDAELKMKHLQQHLNCNPSDWD